MAEESKNDSQTSDDQLVVVTCTSSGKIRRFAKGVKAGFALSIINKKLDPDDPLALYIEADKEGEEPIVFAPDSVLKCYGPGWKLHTVVQPQGDCKGNGAQVKSKRGYPKPLKGHLVLVHRATLVFLLATLLWLKGPKQMTAAPVISYTYIGKVISAFGLIFLLGAVFTLALESLPRLILFISSTYGNIYTLLFSSIIERHVLLFSFCKQNGNV